MLFTILLVVAVVHAREDTDWFGEKTSDKTPGTPEYGHEAFMGKLGAEDFEDLDPVEKESRLSDLFEQIDKNSDQNVSESELKDWILFRQHRYIDENANEQFDLYDLNDDDVISWKEYLQAYYDLRDIEDDDDIHPDQKDALDSDHEKFMKADVNADEQCSRDEFRAFVDPERFDHMRDFVLKESLKIMDANSDDFVDKKEYVATMEKINKGDRPDSWLADEHHYFDNTLDKNRDGVLDPDELYALLISTTVQEAVEEAKHLIKASDDNKDGGISKHEMLIHRDVFITSTSDDYDRILHDEF